jgi:glycosyltransferase involved in cell wall biosynthesis
VENLSVVVPVYNAEAFISFFLKELILALTKLPQEAEIVIVDDGSTDQSAVICREILTENWHHHQVIVLSRNQGQYYATVNGCVAAKGDMLITIDNDFSPPPTFIPDILNQLPIQPDTIYYGEFIRKTAVFRNLGSHFFNMLIKSMVGKDTGTNQGSSFRIFRKELFDKVGNHEFDPILLDVLMMKFAKSVEFIPLRITVHSARSSQNLVRLAGYFIKLIVVSYVVKRYGHKID